MRSGQNLKLKKPHSHLDRESQSEAPYPRIHTIRYEEAFFSSENQEKKGSRFALARLMILLYTCLSTAPPPVAQESLLVFRNSRVTPFEVCAPNYY